MPRIVGYTYSADVYCVMCTRRVHAYTCTHTDAVGRGVRTCSEDPMLDEHGIAEDALDSYGERVHPVFSTVSDPDDAYCGRCGIVVLRGTQECGRCHAYGHSADDCPLGEDERNYGDPNDFYETCNDCDCVDCVAASLYTGEVA